MGKNDEEALTIDVIHTTVGELGMQVVPYFFGDVSKDEEKKEEFRKELMEKLPTWFNFLNRKLEARNNGEQYFMGADLSLADFLWAYVLSFMKPIDKEGTLASAYPKLFALAGRVHALPAIKEFIAKYKKD